MQSLSSRTRSAAYFLRLVCLAAICGLGAIAVYVALNTDILVTRVARDLLADEPLWTVHGTARVLLLIIGGAGLAATGFILWHMARLFGCYATGDPLSPKAARAIRLIGLGLLAQAAISVLGRTASGLALSIDAPPGRGMLVIQFGSPDLGLLLAGGLLVLIGLVMAQAVAAARENQEFV